MRFTHNAVADEETKLSRIPKKYQSIVIFLRDAAVAAAFVALVLLAMFAYTGLWPPLVVVESNSMMHGEDNHSNIGTIDTGDLVLVKKVNSVADVETYMNSQISGHKTYGDYGDVVIYKRGGSDASTPIIHRALIYLEINSDGTSYRSQSLRQAATDKWSTSDPTDTWDRLTSSLTINDVGYNHLSVTIDIHSLVSSHRSGFITKGDHNLGTDQMYAAYGPVDFEWVVGKARGEIPWFGLLKLWSTGSLGSPSPDNSVRDLWASLAIIVAAPIIIDISLTYREKREVSKKRAAELLKKESAESGEEKKAEAEDLDETSDQPPTRP
jgi:signal peptidase